MMTATLEKAWGYQGDNMNLPERDLLSRRARRSVLLVR